MSALQAAVQNLQPLLPETLDELKIWRRQDRQAVLWWRDDDAIADGPDLRRLLDLSTRHRFPLTLAVIPQSLETSLAPALSSCPDLTVIQHGFSHQNHAPSGNKKCELDDNRDPEEVLSELQQGADILATAFGDRFTAALAPPWNRIGPEITRRLNEAGLAGLSLYGDKSGDGQHTHLDIIDWKGSRGFIGASNIDLLFATALRRRREGAVNPASPIGLLTHHLVHDDMSWRFLEAFAGFVTKDPALLCRGGAEIFA